MSEQTAAISVDEEIKGVVNRCMKILPGRWVHVSCFYTISGKYNWSISAVDAHGRFGPNASSYDGLQDAEMAFQNAVVDWRASAQRRIESLRQEADELERQAKGPANE